MQHEMYSARYKQTQDTLVEFLRCDSEMQWATSYKPISDHHRGHPLGNRPGSGFPRFEPYEAFNPGIVSKWNKFDDGAEAHKTLLHTTKLRTVVSV